MFEGIRGPSFEGDIAIDDVSITIGKCKQENTVASAGKTGKSFFRLGDANVEEKGTKLVVFKE